MTFDDIAQRVAAHYQPAPIAGPTAALTAKGHAAVAGYRFLRALRELDRQQRAEALAEFAPQLRDVIAELAVGA